MKNRDAAMQTKLDLMNGICNAVKDGNDTELLKNMTAFQEFVQDQVRDEYKGLVDSQDNRVLAARGVRMLTSEETAFYDAFIEANRQANFKDAITNIDKAFPETIIDTVLEDIGKAFPLLDALNIVNSTMITKWVVNDKAVQKAKWGAITSAYTQELSGQIRVIDTTMCKLTAIMFVPKDLLDMGPRWVDRYVRAILVEAEGAGFEEGIIAGTGKDEPIGMIKDVSDTASVVGGVYPDKSQITLDVITPKTIGDILATMAVSRTGRVRKLGKLIFVCNPLDYFTKVMPATTVLVNGGYVNNVMPVPMQIIQSAAVPRNSAVIADVDGYFACMGAKKRNAIEYDDSFKFGDDLRTYAIKMHANGRALDDNCCKYLDITNLESAFWANSPSATAVSTKKS